MPRVLIADESYPTRVYLKSIVEGLGHQVIGLASNSAQAIALYRRERPDIVTMEIGMEGKDGIPALKEIMDEDPVARVLLVVGSGNEHKRKGMLRMGATGFIRKPYKWEEIYSEFHRVSGENEK
ncbi:MAG: response regulator [Deltaproteobacteria bacterium]